MFKSKTIRLRKGVKAKVAGTHCTPPAFGCGASFSPYPESRGYHVTVGDAFGIIQGLHHVRRRALR